MAAQPVPAPPHRPLLGLATQALQAQLAVLTEQDPVQLGERQALDEAAALLAASGRLQILALQRLADVDNRQLFTLDGLRSVRMWLQRHGLEVERSQLALARKLHRLPAVAHALRTEQLLLSQGIRIGQAIDTLRPHLDRPDATIDGQRSALVLPAVIVDGVLSVLAEGRGGYADDDAQLALLRRALQNLAQQPHSSERDQLEATFVLLARQLDPGLLASALDALVGALLPNELEKANTDAIRRRALTLTRSSSGTGWLVRGELTAEAGELLHTALHAESLTDPANPTDTTDAADLLAAHPDRDPQDLPSSRFTDHGGPRTRAQRMHDALLLALRHLLDSGNLGTRNSVAPHLGVLVSLETLHNQPGALPARADSGALLPTSLVRTLWCQAELTRIVLSAGRRVMEVSHTQRLHRPHERKALAIQWGHTCAAAGCCPQPRPGRKLIPHHINPFADCGITALKDSVPLCEPTHQHLHHGHNVQLKDGRWIGPHGWLTTSIASGT